MSNTTAFINSIKNQAIADMKKYEILASLTIAQAILESGWGTSALTKLGNNLFGIKATNWGGESLCFPTIEYDNNRQIIVDAEFRKYPSWAESIADHTQLLITDRYKNIVGDYDYKSVCQKIYMDGYATDPNYTENLINIIETYKLSEFDFDYKIERLLNDMNIKELQRWLNQNGFTDEGGAQLVEDGIEGQHTRAAKEKAKIILNYILK